MKTLLLLTVLLLYSIGLLFNSLSIRFFNGLRVAASAYREPIFWLGPLAFMLLGLAIGGILILIISPKNKTRLLLYSSLAGVPIYCLTTTCFQFSDWYHSRYYANIEYNQQFLDNSSSYPLQEKQAFKMLTDKYSHPNDLRIWEESVSRYDSIVNKKTTDVYDVGFTYTRKNHKGLYRSRCMIIGDQPNLQYVDHLLSESEERSLDSSDNESRRRGLQTILDDSAKLSLDSPTKASIRMKLRSKKIALDTLPE